METKYEKGITFPREGYPVDDSQDQVLLNEYEPPRTQKTGVETEGGFCASEQIEEEIKAKDGQGVEVEEYKSFENNITFD